MTTTKRKVQNGRVRGGAGVTIRDVAMKAGVSPMTVSNVINARHQAMSAATRRRVEAVIEKLNYRPHTSAQSLRLARRLAMGLLIVDESPTFLADPFTTHLVAGVSRFLSEKGYALVLEGMRPGRLAEAQVMCGVRTDGMFLMLSGNRPLRTSIMKQVADLGQPTIVFQEHLTVPHDDSAVVRQDDRLGGRSLAEHVLASGARKLFYLTPSLSWPALEERAEGIREAVRRSKGQCEVRIVRCGRGDYADTQGGLKKAVDEIGIPDAVLAANDQMGIAAMKWLEHRKIRVPDAVRVTGFNAFEFSQYTSPTLTTVRSDAYEMGVRGASLLLDRLKTGRFEQRELVLPVEFQVGGSA